MFDVELGNFSMEQLVERQDKLYQRLNFANHVGSGQMIDALHRLIAAVEMEVTNRVAVDTAMALLAATPSIIESDPDLARLHHKEVAQQDDDDVQPELTRRTRQRRSAVKLTPADLDKD